MKIVLTGLNDSPRNLIRRAGYGEHLDRRSGETSYSKRLGPGIFPKFHAYLAERAGGVEVSLHLDQKKPTYGMETVHSGEYEGPLVERELARIREVFEKGEPEDAD